ncbi:MAG: hypothetical protein LBT53_01195 [Puniceicoccales bacterium]|jgi:hypothetical protein|nr:hypothetical protein [Puniceicoccales bacterium]
MTRTSFFKCCAAVFAAATFAQTSAAAATAAAAPNAETAATPRLVNIINFIRQTEPRPLRISDADLFECTATQVRQLRRHALPATFLLQYDALINPKYVELLKNETQPGTEIGAWWEITEPHVKAAGIAWRGRKGFAWDWHANVGFATGYTPAEREILADVYMKKFKETFGKYPASVGSWFIDAHTLDYMQKKYGITASCNCKDQIGTDGYTLWGGYWNQAYYPSRQNAYMPAQNAAAQIPVPIFRMLGSDPLYQYDANIGGGAQHVISLEPVYGADGKRVGGGSKEWVDWFFRNMFEAPALGFNYAQAGQENSFTWRKMRVGLEYQIPLLADLWKQKKIRVETLEDSAKWFRGKYAVTPPTAFSALDDYRDKDNKTVWFNSRFFRANLFWSGKQFRFRDIHLFDENFASDYLTRAERNSTQCIFTTLPFVDGNVWSARGALAGLRIVETKSGAEIPLAAPEIKQLAPDVLQVSCAAPSGNVFRIVLTEDALKVESARDDVSWALELSTAAKKKLPFEDISAGKIKAKHRGFAYSVECRRGRFEKASEAGKVFRIYPAEKQVLLGMRTNKNTNTNTK